MKKSIIERQIFRVLALFTVILFSVSCFLYFSATKSMKMGAESVSGMSQLTRIMLVSHTISETVSNYKQLGIGQGKNGMELLKTINNYKDQFKVQKEDLLKVIPEKSEQEKINSLETTYNEMNQFGEKMAMAFLSEDMEEGKKINVQFNTLAEKIQTGLKEFVDMIEKNLKSRSESSLSLAKQVKTFALGIMIFSLAMAAFLTRYLLKSVRSVLENQAKNLSEEKRLLEERLIQIVGRLAGNYEKLQSTVTNLDESSSNLSMSSSRQASATEEAVAAMEEISSMVKQTSENGNYSLQVAKECQTKVDTGQSVVEGLSDAMNEINKSNAELATIVNLINEISAKTKVINSIVVKTELLSFNASIEAARAAEYGKGFAVVAEEVGNLARLSGESAKEIESLLEESALRVSEIVELIQSRVSVGQDRSGECVNVFSKISELSGDLSNSVNSISTACNEQTKGVDQTTIAMNDISKATQENLMITNDTSKLSNHVRKEIDDLSDTIEDLKDLIRENEDEETHNNSNSSKNTNANVINFKKAVADDDAFDPDKIANSYSAAVGDGSASSSDDEFFE